MTSVLHIRRQDLEMVEKIGAGGFSSVYHMIWKRESGENIHVAAKRLYTVEMQEQEVLSTLNHPNIVKLIGVVPEELDFMLILELCEVGSLRAYLDSHDKKPLPPGLLKTWSVEAARAIEYLQEQNVVHKDIKSQNYVISSTNVLKLTDFGLAKKLQQSFASASQRGTVAYMAPELLKDSKLSQTKFDIFAYGVVLWEMLTGQVPYEGMEYIAIVGHVCRENKHLQIPEDCPDHITELLNMCWLADHARRPGIQEVLAVLDRKCRLNTSSWECVRQFGHQDEPGRLRQASGIAVHKNGDVAVCDKYDSQVKVYTDDGRFKFNVDICQRSEDKSVPWEVAISTNGNYFVTDHLNPCVKIYNLEGKFKTKIDIKDQTLLVWPAGLAFDNDGNLLVGSCSETWIDISLYRDSVRQQSAIPQHTGLIRRRIPDKYIRVHTSDGELLRNIELATEPYFIAVTRRNTIIVSSVAPSVVHILDMKGNHIHTLPPPPQVKHWRPTGVCCSEDTIFVANDNRIAPQEYGIYCYSLLGDYLGCATKEVTNPTGIALTADGNKLLVAQYELSNPTQDCGMHGVKVFQRNQGCRN